ncbi:hypothetical protein GCM10017668_65440 [Streptomyces tuirus]|uniref:Uncharacterized protein n=1 Tax=Streptomyces tuirus TaxID=68278 RepID=A0A7G1NQC8_9ACTN|nr:hypothetical protein GCM10017668_65440 [Streptomyces tuirus]
MEGLAVLRTVAVSGVSQGPAGTRKRSGSQLGWFARFSFSTRRPAISEVSRSHQPAA